MITLSRGRYWPTAALGLATAFLIAPLWCVQSPGMPDYPAHLASFYLISGGAQAASRFYFVHWTLVPNLASELLVPFLAQLMSLEAAAKLFLSVGIAMWVLGPAAIQRALFGRVGLAPLAGAFFAYSANFTWGFFNYYFATGLCFLIFAAWIATAGKRGPFALASFAVMVCVLYVGHLFACALLALMIGCFEISSAWEIARFSPKTLVQRALPVGLIFLPALLAFAILRPAGIDSGQFAFNFDNTIDDRVGAAIQYYFGEPAYLVMGALAIAWLTGLIYGRLRLHPLMKLTVVALAVLTLVSPEWALGGWGVHLRLPAVLGAIMFACVDLRLDKRLSAALGFILVCAIGWAAFNLADNWRDYDRQYSEFRAALRELPRDVKLVTVLDSDAMDDEADQPYWHMAEFAIIDRGGFSQLMFTTKGQHIVQLKPPFDKLAAASAPQGSPPDLSELADLAAGRAEDDPDIDDVFPYLKFFQCHFDEAVIIHGDGVPSEVPNFLTLRHAGSFFSLYDIAPTGACKRQ